MASKRHQSISCDFYLTFPSDRELLDCSNCVIPTNCQGETKFHVNPWKLSRSQIIKLQSWRRKHGDWSLERNTTVLHSLKTSRPRWFDARANLLVNLSWDCINRVCWFWHPCSRDIAPMDLQMHWIVFIFLISNPKGTYEPNLKGFLITLSRFRMALHETVWRNCDSFQGSELRFEFWTSANSGSAPPPTIMVSFNSSFLIR